MRNFKSIAKRVYKKINKDDLEFYIDSPVDSLITEKITTIDGWVFSKSGKAINVRITNGKEAHNINKLIKRADVASAHNLSKEKAYCGFSKELLLKDGPLIIEANTGSGFRTIYKLNIKYSPEKLVEYYFNPSLSENYAKHQNLIENRKLLYFEEKQNNKYVRFDEDPKLVALYLPQFHPIELNNDVWGEGFTEWSNTTTSIPRFIGHQQPVLPRDLGFYDLRNEWVLREQINLAKEHGIYGFSFYYYWFSGKKILDTPINSVVKNKDWDFNFMICWANENWTKRWDGRDSEIIIAQEYKEEDPLNFIKDVEHILNDPRYINHEGKPVLMVYRVSDLVDPLRYSEVWRKYFKDKYDKELYLISVISFEAQDPREYGFDAALDFAPLSIFFKGSKFIDKTSLYIDVSKSLLDKHFSGKVFDYRKIAINKNLVNAFDFPTHKCVMPSWDNDARKKGKGFVSKNSSPDIYQYWLNHVIEHEKSKVNNPLIFINAWNEWAEGTMLEPSMHLGRSILNRTTESLLMCRDKFDPTNNFNFHGISKSKDTNLAIVIHLYHTDRWESIKSKLDLINVKKDIIVTLNIRDAEFKKEILRYDNNANVLVFPNRGRDVLPFLIIAKRLDTLGYKYILKLHSKKSPHRENGDDWFVEMLDELIPRDINIKEILDVLNLAPNIIGPSSHYVDLKRYMGGDEHNIVDIVDDINQSKKYAANYIKNQENGFFAGTMFWSSIKAIKPLLDLYYLPDDFESESGQVDGTKAHAIERLFGLLPEQCGGKNYSINSNSEIHIANRTNKNYSFAD